MPPPRRPKSKKALLQKSKTSDDRLRASHDNKPDQPRCPSKSKSQFTQGDHKPRRSTRIAERLQSSKVSVAVVRTPLPEDRKSSEKPFQPSTLPELRPDQTREKPFTGRESRSARITPSQARATREVELQKNPQIASWIEKFPEQNPQPPGDLTAGKYLTTNFDQKSEEVMTDLIATSFSRVPVTGTRPQTVATLETKSRLGQHISRLELLLCLRNADPNEPTDDPLLKSMLGLLNVKEKVLLLSKSTVMLQKIVQEFANKLDKSTPNQDVFNDFQDFQDKMNAWKPSHKLFTLTTKDFDFDRHHSLENNEAGLEGTVLTSMIDRWRLNKLFTFSCESQFKKDSPLPMLGATGPPLKGPKPDLVIYYRFRGLFGEPLSSLTSFPPPMVKYVFPDSNLKRCFPFVFIEAKRGGEALNYANYSNMLHASQALWNMYQWMMRSKEPEAFFKHVRVFSVSLNATKLVARVHRAERHPKRDGLRFLYDELYTLNDYTQSEASLLIRNILLEYGVVRLRRHLVAASENIIQTQLPKLEQIKDLWDLPEVREAASWEMLSSGDGRSAAETDVDAASEAMEHAPEQLLPSKRPAAAESSGGRKRQKKIGGYLDPKN